MATLRQQIATHVLSATRYRDLLNLVRQHRPKDDIELVKKAYEFSQKHHAGQTRASRAPYLVHPLEVGIILTDIRLDTPALAALPPDDHDFLGLEVLDLCP